MDRPPGTSAVARVQAALAAHGLADRPVKQFDESTATAADAAAAIGTSVERIVKSLVFVGDDRPVLVLVSGPNRVSLDKLSELLGAGVRVRRANADEVRRSTGYAIGGVPPLGHDQPLQTYIDGDLLQFDEVWAAAGTPNAVFPIDPRELVRVTQGQVAVVKQDA